MKILVVSDTHGDISGVQEALRREGPVDYVFHLGDNARDAARIQTTAHMVSVLGNCDFGGAPLTETVFLCGKRLLLTHGHGQSVKYGLQRLAYFAAGRRWTRPFSATPTSPSSTITAASCS